MSCWECTFRAALIPNSRCAAHGHTRQSDYRLHGITRLPDHTYFYRTIVCTLLVSFGGSRSFSLVKLYSMDNDVINNGSYCLAVGTGTKTRGAINKNGHAMANCMLHDSHLRCTPPTAQLSTMQMMIIYRSKTFYLPLRNGYVLRAPVSIRIGHTAVFSKIISQVIIGAVSRVCELRCV